MKCFILFPLLLLAMIQPVFAASPTQVVNNIVIKGPWIDASAYNTLAAGDAAAVAAGKLLVISTVWSMVPPVLNANIKVLPSGGVNNSEPLAINGTFDAGMYQVFKGNGPVSFGKGTVKEVNVIWWGADPTGTVDSTSAFERAIYAYAKTSPSGKSGWGQGLVFVPKGIFRVDGTIGSGIAGSPALLGIKFYGAGQFATTVTRTTDTGVMFNMGIVSSFEVSDMSFKHIAVGANTTWTNDLFNYNGKGGGQKFLMRRVYTSGFNRVMWMNGTLNGDTNYFQDCTFNNCNIFLDSDNTQAILNTFDHCTWNGAITYAFNIAGFHRTRITDSNIIMDGTFINMKDTAQKWSAGSYFELTNCKMEWTAAHNIKNHSKTPKLINADGASVSGTIVIRGCGLTGGGIKPWRDARWITVGGPVFVSVDNSFFEGKIEVKSSTSYQPMRLTGIDIKNSSLNAPSEIIFTDTSTLGAVYPNISFTNCRSTGGHVVYSDITLAKGTAYPNSGTVLLTPLRFANLSKIDVAVSTLVAAGSALPQSLSLPFYGQYCSIKSVTINTKKNYTGTDTTSTKIINIYNDTAKTVLIGTVTIPAATTTRPVIYPVTIDANVYTNEGIYVEIVQGAGTTSGYLTGTISIEYTAI
ncbi:MAG: hypothetical protein WC156_04190 [Pedobacter sp.]